MPLISTISVVLSSQTLFLYSFSLVSLLPMLHSLYRHYYCQLI